MNGIYCEKCNKDVAANPDEKFHTIDLAETDNILDVDYYSVCTSCFKEYKTLMRKWINKTYGDMVRASRRKMMMNQQEIADRIGISRVYLSQIENDRAEGLSLKIFAKLSRTLGLDLQDSIDMYSGEM